VVPSISSFCAGPREHSLAVPGGIWEVFGLGISTLCRFVGIQRESASNGAAYAPLAHTLGPGSPALLGGNIALQPGEPSRRVLEPRSPSSYNKRLNLDKPLTHWQSTLAQANSLLKRSIGFLRWPSRIYPERKEAGGRSQAQISFLVRIVHT
jgi:hypothetical protein